MVAITGNSSQNLAWILYFRSFRFSFPQGGRVQFATTSDIRETLLKVSSSANPQWFSQIWRSFTRSFRIFLGFLSGWHFDKIVRNVLTQKQSSVPGEMSQLRLIAAMDNGSGVFSYQDGDSESARTRPGPGPSSSNGPLGGAEASSSTSPLGGAGPSSSTSPPGGSGSGSSISTPGSASAGEKKNFFH